MSISRKSLKILRGEYLADIDSVSDFAEDVDEESVLEIPLDGAPSRFAVSTSSVPSYYFESHEMPISPTEQLERKTSSPTIPSYYFEHTASQPSDTNTLPRPRSFLKKVKAFTNRRVAGIRRSASVKSHTASLVPSRSSSVYSKQPTIPTDSPSPNHHPNHPASVYETPSSGVRPPSSRYSTQSERTTLPPTPPRKPSCRYSHELELAYEAVQKFGRKSLTPSPLSQVFPTQPSPPQNPVDTPPPPISKEEPSASHTSQYLAPLTYKAPPRPNRATTVASLLSQASKHLTPVNSTYKPPSPKRKMSTSQNSDRLSPEACKSAAVAHRGTTIASLLSQASKTEKGSQERASRRMGRFLSFRLDVFDIDFDKELGWGEEQEEDGDVSGEASKERRAVYQNDCWWNETNTAVSSGEQSDEREAQGRNTMLNDFR